MPSALFNHSAISLRVYKLRKETETDFHICTYPIYLKLRVYKLRKETETIDYVFCTNFFQLRIYFLGEILKYNFRFIYRRYR